MYALYYIVSNLCCISGMILGDFSGFTDMEIVGFLWKCVANAIYCG